MKRVLVDVDTQRDFVRAEGTLFVPAPEGTLERIRSRLAHASQRKNGYAAVVGSVDSHAYDAWEFQANGGPFPPHCVKGQEGWLRHFSEVPLRQRFIPMGHLGTEKQLLTTADTKPGGNSRSLYAADLAQEALDGIGLYFEKEVYSLFANPLAEVVMDELVLKLGGRHEVCFDVLGYCTGGYCVDAAAEGLRARGYAVRIFEDETVAIGGDEGMAQTRTRLEALGVTWIAASYDGPR